MPAEPETAAALEQALRESQRRLGTVVAGAPLVLWAVDRDLKFTLCEGRGLEVFGLTPDQMVGRDAAALYADRPEIVECAKRALAGEEVHDLVDYFGHVWDVTYAPLWSEGRIEGVIGVNTDVTDRRRTEQALEASELRYRSLVEELPDAVLGIDGNGTVMEVNPAAVRLLGRPREDLAGRAFLALVTEATSDDPAAMGSLVVCRPDGREVPVELQMIRHESKDGAAVTAVLRDLTERRRHESRLRDLADHDPLTGLLNRRRFEEELARVIARCARYGRTAAAVLLDLDELKAVNDADGHVAGDAMLRQAASALLARVRADDVLARLGGDEFGVVLEAAGAEEAERVAEDLLSALREEPLTVGTHGTHMSASAGVALVDGGSTPEVVLDRADAAMYEAKELGRDRVVMVGSTDEAPVARAAGLGRADPRGAGRAPLRAARPGDDRPRHGGRRALRGARAPARARRPAAAAAGLPRPGRARRPGRGARPRRRRAGGERAGRGARRPRASRSTSRRPAWPSRASRPGSSRPSSEAGVEPDRLVLEFAEHAAMNDTEHASAFATAVREHGMGVALDDFGAGFASFTALKHVPLDFVKIDREYSAGARTVRADRVLVRGLVQMARGLGIRTIAQHVEDAKTQEALRELGVDLGAGPRARPRAADRAGARAQVVPAAQVPALRTPMRIGVARWSQAHVRRLYWRAGFGATPREAAHWARRGKHATLRHLLDTGGPGAARRQAAAGQGPAARPGERVGPRRPVVAGPDGPLLAAAGGEAHALLARPLRHRRRGPAADARPEPGAARATRWARSRRCWPA